MVDALQRAIQHLRPGGVLIDLRPDGSRKPRLLSRARVIGYLLSREEVALDDTAADRAVATVVKRNRLRRIERGHLWHGTSFRDRRELDQYLRASPRYAGLTPGTRARIGGQDRLVMRRAIKYDVLAAE